MSNESASSKNSHSAWYISRNGEASGPLATDLVVSMLRNGQLQSLDLVYREGETEWRPAAMFRELKTSHAAATSAPTISETVLKTPSPVSKPHRASELSWIVLRPHASTYLQEGPFETDVIIEGLQKGRFQYSQYAWHEGMSQWMRIGDLREFDRRSRARDAKPHVPPPLPDPITAVLLEDDADSEAEEFHISVRAVTKQDLTPNPMESVQAMSSLPPSQVGIGGAAAESPENRRPAGEDLASVPWEREAGTAAPSGVSSPVNVAQEVAVRSVELIDDEHSGVYIPPVLQDEEPVVIMKPGEVLEAFEKTPLPFVPAAPMPMVKDAWEKWGRHAAGASLLAVFVLFVGHLATAPSARVVTKRVRTKAPVAELTAQASTAPPASAMGPAPSAKSAKSPTVSVAPPVPPAPPTPVVSDVSVVGIKLDRPDGQIVIQGSIPAGVPVEVSLKGRLGQVLSKLNVRKTVKLERKGAEIPSLSLKTLKLPDGAYTVEVAAGGVVAKNEIFVGVRNAKFLDRLEAHLRAVSFESQSQKKLLFYSAQELDVLARELGQNYGQLRGKPQAWAAYFKKWSQRINTLQRSVAGLEKKSLEDQAYPEETASLSQVLGNLADVAQQYDQAIGQKRDIASDTLTELIAELARQKAAIGETTARPTANTPDGML